MTTTTTAHSTTAHSTTAHPVPDATPDGAAAPFAKEAAGDGTFRRQGNRFTDRITPDSDSAPGGGPDPERRWPLEAGRYRLVVSLACPWAHRSVIDRRLLGLEDALSMAVVDPIRDDRGWRFTLDPAARAEMDAVMDEVFRDVNNGVYRCGFATSQAAYEKAYRTLWARMDVLEERLADRRFLMGDSITEADVRLFTTLVRFDVVYHGHFKANRTKLTELPNLWRYARELFAIPGFGDTVDFDQIKRHYYVTHPTINPTGIVPVGPDPSVWTR